MKKYKSKIVYEFVWQNGDPEKMANEIIKKEEKEDWILYSNQFYLETVPMEGVYTVMVFTFRKYLNK